MSDDLKSSKVTFTLKTIPCVGTHPWEVEGAGEEISEIEKPIPEACYTDEVELDNRFVKDRKA